MNEIGPGCRCRLILRSAHVPPCWTLIPTLAKESPKKCTCTPKDFYEIEEACQTHIDWANGLINAAVTKETASHHIGLCGRCKMYHSSRNKCICHCNHESNFQCACWCHTSEICDDMGSVVLLGRD